MQRDFLPICRAASLDDEHDVLALWQLLFEEMDAQGQSAWAENARRWFLEQVDDERDARISVIEFDRNIVATAVGTIELGVPNPQSPRGRGVRLANVVTLPAHRGKGYGTELVKDVVEWARGLGADRVDLSATPDGQRLYEQLGFVYTSAPRMKLVL